MKRRTLYVAILAAVALAICLAWFFWPRHATGPLPRLIIARQTVLEGKPLVVFRIEAERRIQINGFELIRGNKREGWPIETINANQNEFGAFPPTDATVWQMAVFVDMESSDPLNGLKRMAATWKLMRQHGSSFYNAAQMSRKMFYPVESKWVENAPITNTVPVGMQQFFRLSQ